MARLSEDEERVNARIVYWGAEGSGKTENLRDVFRKLRPDHRGILERVPTRIDPTVYYEKIPIELGDVGGFRTAIDLIAVPGGADQMPTRKQLLDEIDGIVLVIDSQAERIADNEASLEELTSALSDYGRILEDIPLVIQYNKRDLSDPYTLDELHRRLEVSGAAVFESVATESIGTMQTLSTLSKSVIRTLRDRKFNLAAEPEATEAPPPETVEIESAPTEIDLDFMVDSDPEPAERMEAAILDEASHPDGNAISEIATQAESILDDTWDSMEAAAQNDDTLDEFEVLESLDSFDGSISNDSMESPADVEADPSPAPQLGPELSIASVGEATRSGERSVRVPLVVADKEGRSSTLVLTISLDAVADETPD